VTMRLRMVPAVLLAAALAGGCTKAVTFPAEPVSAGAPGLPAGAVAYDTSGGGGADFALLAGPGGRADRIAYLRDGNAPPEIVNLDYLPLGHCRHLIVILDGFGYDVVKGFRDSGGLRLFHAPSRVIAPYPTLTDPCIEDLLNYMPCPAFEAEYYDRVKGRHVGGDLAYLAGRNMPYNRLLNYRANTLLDAVMYLLPWDIYRHEIGSLKKTFDRRLTQQVLAYVVSSAGMGTKYGADGQRRCLRLLDRLILQIVQETHGLTKVTLLADHGHSYTPARRIPLEDYLKSRGWRLTETLRGPRDVDYIRFGLETYASFATNSPGELAADLVGCEGVELASCVGGDGNSVRVLAPGGASAVIARSGSGYCYRSEGDPLKLEGILAKLHPDANGFYGADELLAATYMHEYPAPLQRLWRAHFGLVDHPPDVIISLRNGWFSGSAGLAAMARIASTHGGLNRTNSTTFIMSTAGPLPPVLRSRDVPAAMTALTGAPWPGRRPEE